MRHGFVLLFEEKPSVDLYRLEEQVREAVKKDLPVSYYDENHVQIGDHIMECLDPECIFPAQGKSKTLLDQGLSPGSCKQDIIC